jgi:hypothetical protein
MADYTIWWPPSSQRFWNIRVDIVRLPDELELRKPTVPDRVVAVRLFTDDGRLVDDAVPILPDADALDQRPDRVWALHFANEADGLLCQRGTFHVIAIYTSAGNTSTRAAATVRVTANCAAAPSPHDPVCDSDGNESANNESDSDSERDSERDTRGSDQ